MDASYGRVMARKIYQNHHNIKLPKNMVVHHIDGDPTNNAIDNLQAMEKATHTSIHKKGVPIPRKEGGAMNLYLRNFPEDLNKFLKRVALDKNKSKEQVVIEILQSWIALKAKREREEAGER